MIQDLETQQVKFGEGTRHPKHWWYEAFDHFTSDLRQNQTARGLVVSHVYMERGEGHMRLYMTQAVNEHETIVSRACYSFDIDSECCIDDLCKMVLVDSGYVGGSVTTVKDETRGTAPTLKTGASKYGKALIHKLELLKDTRFSHWRHEFIVLTLTYANERRLLYLEHSWQGTGLGERIPVTLSSLVGSQKGSADEAMFYKPNDPHEDHRRRYTMTVFEIQFSAHPTHTSPVTLHSIARILRQMGTKHGAYALFSANCWAWSRGIVMAIALESSSNVETVTMTGKDITLHQLKYYLLTEYGAFGGMLLHCIEKGRHDLRWYEYCTLRCVYFLYAFIGLGLWLNHIIVGPLNWTLRVKELCIREDRTTDTNGQDHTYDVLPPDLTDLIPTFPGTATHLLGYHFCGPSKYLYVLAAPIATSGARVTSVHIFIYGTVELKPGQEKSVSDSESALNRMEWFRCAILRQTQDGRLVEVSEPACFSLRVQFRSVGKRSYGAVHVMEHHHPLTLGLRQGDSIAIWALGRTGYIHKPAGAWIKVVTKNRLGFLDWLVAMDVARRIAGLIIYPRGHTWPEIVGQHCHELKYLFFEIPWCLNSLCNDWPWSAISMIASHMLSTVTPLQLPEGDGDEHPVEVTLSNFIEQLLSPNGGKGSPFCRATIRSISLGQAEIDLFKIIVLLVTLDNVEYYVHIRHPKDEESLWHHFITCLWSYHGLIQDTVVIYRPGNTQRTAWEALDIDFTAELSVNSDTAASQNILSVALHLRDLRNRYWWSFWLNENWQWPISIVKAIMKCADQTIRVQLQCDEEPLQIDSWEQTNELLGNKVTGWKHAEGRIYGNGMKDDVLVLFTHARARFLIWSNMLISIFLYVYYHF